MKVPTPPLRLALHLCFGRERWKGTTTSIISASSLRCTQMQMQPPQHLPGLASTNLTTNQSFAPLFTDTSELEASFSKVTLEDHNKDASEKNVAKEKHTPKKGSNIPIRATISRVLCF